MAADTLLSVRTSVLKWLRGDYALDSDVDLVNEAINDALQSIWNKMIITQYERFFNKSSPITFQAPIGAERVNLTTIDDPVNAPILNFGAGGTLPAQDVFGCYTYVTDSGQETLPSPITRLPTPIGNLITAVALTPVTNPNVFGWNFYAYDANLGINPQLVFALQNEQPIPLEGFFQEPITGIVPFGNDGQTVPTINTTGDNIAWIDHLEIRTSDQLLHAWNQHGLDSSAMRQMAATLATASEYQKYAWDLINGNIIEFRPSLALNFSPRYWPVVKPRRLIYDGADFPYMDIAGVREFVVSKAVADLKLAIEEYLAQQAWSGKANAAAAEVQIALTAENFKKNTRITPFMR